MEVGVEKGEEKGDVKRIRGVVGSTPKNTSTGAKRRLKLTHEVKVPQDLVVQCHLTLAL